MISDEYKLALQLVFNNSNLFQLASEDYRATAFRIAKELAEDIRKESD